MARLKLWKAFKVAEKIGAKVLYCDTDSLFTTKPLPQSLVGEELGELKLEDIAIEGWFIAPKIYALKCVRDNEIYYIYKIKGIPCESFEEWKSIVFRHESKEIKVPAKIRTFLKTGKEVYQVAKTVREPAEKRIFNDIFSQPFAFSMFAPARPLNIIALKKALSKFFRIKATCL